MIVAIEKESKMAIESIVALGLASAFLAWVSWYASHHRAEDKNKQQKDNQRQAEHSQRHHWASRTGNRWR